MHDWMDDEKLIAFDERFLALDRLSGIDDGFHVCRRLEKYSIIF